MNIHELVNLSLPEWMNDALCREVDRHGMFGGLTPNEREKYEAEHGKAVA